MQLTSDQTKLIRKEIKDLKEKELEKESTNGVELITISSLNNKYAPTQINNLKAAKLIQLKNNLTKFINNATSYLGNYQDLQAKAVQSANEILIALSDGAVGGFCQSGNQHISFGPRAIAPTRKDFLVYQIVMYLQRYAETTYSKAVTSEIESKGGSRMAYKAPGQVGGGGGLTSGLKEEKDNEDFLFTEKKSSKSKQKRYFSTIVVTTAQQIRQFYSKDFRRGLAPLVKYKIIPIALVGGLHFALEDVYSYYRGTENFIGKLTSSKSKIKLSLSKRTPNVFSGYYGSLMFFSREFSDGFVKYAVQGQSINGPQFYGQQRVVSEQQPVQQPAPQNA